MVMVVMRENLMSATHVRLVPAAQQEVPKRLLIAVALPTNGEELPLMPTEMTELLHAPSALKVLLHLLMYLTQTKVFAIATLTIMEMVELAQGARNVLRTKGMMVLLLSKRRVMQVIERLR
jgi:hypothetical protein